MECPNCRHQNPEGAKFCSECGTRLSARCPRCGHANTPGAKYCNECGTALGQAASPRPAPADPQPFTGIQSLIPAEFAAKLETARAQKAMVGERRIVTILFCDVKGSTAAAGHLDPEDWAQIINGAFEAMIRPVYKYEGNVARLMGDAILAFFGAPVAHEDDPQRAVLAALEIVSGFENYKEKMRAEWDLELDLRIGINTGLVMVGAVGSDLQMEYTALGDAINIAARMEQTATPGTIQVAEDTYRLTAPVFDWEELGEQEVKGKAGRLRTYRPVGKKASPGRLRGIEGLDAPLVGRQKEFEQLKSILARLQEGSGGIVFVTGEAGLGKSRLVRELKLENQASIPDPQASITADPAGWQETACLSYETSQPYALFQRLLRRVYDVQEADSPLEMWEKFLPLLQEIPPDATDQGRVFEALFSVRSQSEEQLPEGENFKRQLFELISHLVARWTSEAPQVIVLDDLHWSDPASIELLVHLYPLSEHSPLLLLCAMRPDRTSPAWSAKETAIRDFPHRTLEIPLSALTAQDTDELVNSLLVVADLPDSLRRRILDKTEGNPFFIEEVVRVLIDSGAVVREQQNGEGRWRTVADLEDIDIPGNLQTLLTARIDRLEEEARRTLQLASVIGRSFYYRVLANIHQAATAVRTGLDNHLRTLQRAEMILEAARMPELEYAFRHALTQEAAYNTILLQQRREFHRQVGEAVEALFADRLEEFYPVLAHHFREARDAKAQRYETLAGDAAFRLFAIPEAANHYQRALQAAKRAPFNSPKLTHLYLRLGRCYELQSEHRQAVETYEDMLSRAREQGDRDMELTGLVALGTVLGIPTPVQDPLKAYEVSKLALEIARELGDRAVESRINWNILLLHMYSGHMDLGIPFGEKSATLAREFDQQEQLAHALQDVSLAYMAVGDLRKGREALLEAQPLWIAIGNQPMLAENWTNLAFERVMTGAFDEALEYYEHGYQVADRIRNQWGRANNRVFSPQVHYALGDYDEALRIIEKYLPLTREVGHPASSLMLVQQSWIYESMGLPEKASASAEAAVQDAIQFEPFRYYALTSVAGSRLKEGKTEEAGTFLAQANTLESQKTILEIDIVVALIQIEYAHAAGAAGEADTRMQALLDLLHRSGARYFQPEALQLKSRILRDRGDLPAARDVLLEARATAEAIQFRTRLWHIQAMLARLLEALGDAAAARDVRHAASPVVAHIAGHIRDPVNRAAFLALAESEGIRLDETGTDRIPTHSQEGS